MTTKFTTYTPQHHGPRPRVSNAASPVSPTTAVKTEFMNLVSDLDTERPIISRWDLGHLRVNRPLR
jgi:hypothetical protein